LANLLAAVGNIWAFICHMCNCPVQYENM